MPFLPPNQQRQSTQGNNKVYKSLPDNESKLQRREIDLVVMNGLNSPNMVCKRTIRSEMREMTRLKTAPTVMRWLLSCCCCCCCDCWNSILLICSQVHHSLTVAVATTQLNTLCWRKHSQCKGGNDTSAIWQVTLRDPLGYIFYGVSLASVSCRWRRPPPTALSLTTLLG